MVIGHVFRTILYKQTRLAPISYKDSGLKLLFTFQVWARLFCRSTYFFVFIFSYLLYECVPCHTGQYQTLSISGTQANYTVVRFFYRTASSRASFNIWRGFLIVAFRDDCRRMREVQVIEQFFPLVLRLSSRSILFSQFN